MHPILAYRGRLGPYLVAWLPVTVLLAGLLRVAGGASWQEAAVVAVPMAVLLAFIGLAAYYPCGSARPGEAPLARIVVIQGLAAALSTLFWMFLAVTWVAVLEQVPAVAHAGERLARVAPLLFALGAVLYLLAAALHYVLIAVADTQALERRALELKIQAREAELRALRSQLDPHFLFNALNTLQSLIGRDAEAARATCAALGDFLRHTVRLGIVERITLGEELALVNSYLAVERARFGERLQVEEAVSAATRLAGVPPLILQPLVENAVRHGVADRVGGGTVRIAASCEGSTLEIMIENEVDDGTGTGSGAGVGLVNTRSRLATLYGGEAAMEAGRQGGRFRVVVRMPLSDSTATPV